MQEQANRQPLHTRQVTCVGFSRADGLWDIEGRIVDTKTYPIVIWGEKRVEAGCPVHEMRVRITIDDSFVIRDAVACSDGAPFAECAGIAREYRRLIGLQIGPGFASAVKREFRGALGCTHITEMLGTIATTAMQTVRNGWRRRAGEELSTAQPSIDANRQLLDSCHALRRGGDIARRHFPFEPPAGGGSGSE